ncbi:MAG: tetratricopeptide repeat protein [Candidatus Eremiobacteraeota bacterium]|nr:tetratricopeptide repeat protein [Candidatus Eremiobacteraeota bacterium]MBC5827461.1 tetratricopeptide repeat protein [Candidatus Eremiobacteraeota bacterium]
MTVIGLLASAVLAVSRLNYLSSSGSPPSLAFAALPPVALVSDQSQIADAVHFLENRVRDDPGDALLYNKLGGYYLQDLRETGALQYLDLMSRAAHASLASVPVVRNMDGLSLLTLAEFSSHDFRAARDHARQLTRLDPAREYPYEMLFDSEIELGNYDDAAEAFAQMLRHNNGINLNTETRQARLATLHGDNVSAARHLSNAIGLGLRLAVPPRESVAWSYWQLGETAFNVGDYLAAEQHYRDALITFPGYYRALASLGRVRAARGDLQDAIAHYKAAIEVLPDPTYVAALGDLYKLTGQDKEAADQYALVEVIGHLSVIAGVLYNRPLALFYADHDLKAREAYANARREYALRRDIYGADAVAWTALKAGKVKKAQASIGEAMRLGTVDPRLYYHAGMIARAAGDDVSARNYLRRALTLSPVFDPLQALKATRALEQLKAPS